MKYIDFHCDTISELADHRKQVRFNGVVYALIWKSWGKVTRRIQGFLRLFVDIASVQ